MLSRNSGIAKKSFMLSRNSGIALIVGAVLDIITNILSAVMFPNVQTSTNPLYNTFAVVSLLGTIILLIGLPGLYYSLRPGSPKLSTSGFILIFISGFVIAVLTIITFISLSLGNTLGPGYLLASLVGAVGGILLGIVMVRGGFSRLAGWVLLVGSAATLLTLLPFPPAVSNFLFVVTYVVFFGGLLLAGYTLMQAKPVPSTTEQPIF